MTYWLTSANKKVHQRALNKLVRAFNKSLEQDDLWLGRFMVRQDAAQWVRHDDGSGTELYVRLKFIDRATGRYYYDCNSVNLWRGLNCSGWRIFERMNWLITEHWDIWEEGLSKDLRAWREYNRTTRKV